MKLFRNSCCSSGTILVLLADRPLLTSEFADSALFRPADSAIYVYGKRDEARTHHIENWGEPARDLEVIEVVENGQDGIELASDNDRPISLRDAGELRSIFESKTGRPLYVDITGLSNHVWPALLKTALEMRISTNVLYVEPEDYSYSPSPRENVFFDLSERIDGISPIPQFSNLAEPEEDATTLIPLLGFEGARFQYLLEEIQPRGENIDPVIGVPGFRAEYPFFAYQGNQIPLRSSGAYRNVRYAKANCPFSLYYTLGDIASTYSTRQFFKIGLIGTKPHALGAVLFSLTNPRRVELVYDHTKRRPQRSSGRSRCLLYPVSAFIERLRGV